jgi:hypothetical protein
MAEEGWRGNAHEPVRATGPAEVVQHLVDDDAEGNGDEREVAVARAHRRDAEQEAEGGGDECGRRQRRPERQAEMDRQQRRRIGADAIGGAGREIRNVGRTELKIQSQRQHRIEQGDDDEVQRIGVGAKEERVDQHDQDADDGGDLAGGAEGSDDRVLQLGADLHEAEGGAHDGEEREDQKGVIGRQEPVEQDRADDFGEHHDQRGRERGCGRG